MMIRPASRITSLASRRRLSTTPIYRQQASSSSSSQGPTKDPSHPNLYYHPSPGGTSLSFLSVTPVPRSRTILGSLPLGGGLEDFKEQPEFLKIMHSSIKEALASGKAQSVEFEAATRGSDGYIHITDERAIPPAGRIGETEDLIGSVFVQDGKIVVDTYDPTPTYRLVTSNGPLLLPRGLDQHLITVLEKIDEDEKAGSRS